MAMLDDFYTESPGTQKVAAPSPVTPGQAKATGYEAQTNQVKEEDTASGRMSKITGEDSPLMQRAKQEGILSSASRGLQNSSFSAGSSMGAMVDRASPLAQQDASILQKQQLTNQGDVNRASEITSGRETDVDLANVREKGTADRFNVESQLKANLTDAEAENSMRRLVTGENAATNRQSMINDNAVYLQNLDDKTKTTINDSKVAANMFDSYNASVSQLLANDKISPARMGELITAQRATFQSGLNLIGEISGMTFELDMGTAGAGMTGAIAPPAPAAAPAAAPAPAVRNTGLPPRSFGGRL